MWLFWLWAFLGTDQPSLDPLEQVWSALSSRKTESMGELTARAGKAFLDKPYVEKSLEVEGQERLVLNFDGYDCFTFMETALALARAVRAGALNVFPQELQRIRYRGGKINGYPSRLHYTSDWIFDNVRKGVVVDLSGALGGIRQEGDISFMSEHPDAYRQMADPANRSAMREVEKAINARPRYFLPKNKVAEIETDLHDGDLVAMTTDIKGLDIVHVGIVVKRGKRAHLMHASTKARKVVISEVPLAEYLAGNHRQTGIMVFRPL